MRRHHLNSIQEEVKCLLARSPGFTPLWLVWSLSLSPCLVVPQRPRQQRLRLKELNHIVRRRPITARLRPQPPALRQPCRPLLPGRNLISSQCRFNRLPRNPPHRPPEVWRSRPHLTRHAARLSRCRFPPIRPIVRFRLSRSWTRAKIIFPRLAWMSIPRRTPRCAIT